MTYFLFFVTLLMTAPPIFLSRPCFVKGMPVALLTFCLIAEMPTALFNEKLNPGIFITLSLNFESLYPIWL